jgi:hypothetical protein
MLNATLRVSPIECNVHATHRGGPVQWTFINRVLANRPDQGRLSAGSPQNALEKLPQLPLQDRGWIELHKVFEIVRDSVKPTR